MKLPSKVTPFKESIVAKFIPVLDNLKTGPLSPSDLYKAVKTKITICLNIWRFYTVCLYSKKLN